MPVFHTKTIESILEPVAQQVGTKIFSKLCYSELIVISHFTSVISITPRPGSIGPKRNFLHHSSVFLDASPHLYRCVSSSVRLSVHQFVKLNMACMAHFWVSGCIYILNGGCPFLNASTNVIRWTRAHLLYVLYVTLV